MYICRDFQREMIVSGSFLIISDSDRLLRVLYFCSLFLEIFVEILRAGGAFAVDALTDIYNTVVWKGQMPCD